MTTVRAYRHAVSEIHHSLNGINKLERFQVVVSQMVCRVFYIVKQSKDVVELPSNVDNI